MNILITSVGTATSVNLIKYLKKFTDNIVVGTDINKYGFTAGSVLCDVFYEVPLASSPKFACAMNEIIDKEHIEIFIPINDNEILQSAYNHIGINKTCKSIVPDINIIESCRNKHICNSIAMNCGLNVADYVAPNCKIKKIRRDKIGVGSHGIKIFDANKCVDEFNSETQIIQKYIEGTEYTVDCLTDISGYPLYVVPRKRIEVKNGVATKVLIEKNDKLINDCITLLKKVKIPGFSNIQFIVDKNGINWFIEINPRFSGCGAATILACDQYIPDFFKLFENNCVDKAHKVNDTDIKWNSIVTRYYEEIICSL